LTKLLPNIPQKTLASVTKRFAAIGRFGVSCQRGANQERRIGKRKQYKFDGVNVETHTGMRFRKTISQMA
jgi:hypothetical protein